MRPVPHSVPLTDRLQPLLLTSARLLSRRCQANSGMLFMQKYRPTLQGAFQSHQIIVNTAWHAPAPECTVCYCSGSQNTRLPAASHACMMTGDAESQKSPLHWYNQCLQRVVNFLEYATRAHLSVCVYSKTSKESDEIFQQA